MRRIRLGLALILAAVLGTAASSGVSPGGGDASGATFHCTWTAACPEITISGDPPATLGGGPAPFRGYGDPSMEYDSVTGDIWMAYSWLDLLVTSSGPPPMLDLGVRTHLAKSTDGGQSWTFVREINDTSLISHPDTAAEGWLIHEVPAVTRRGDGDWETLWFTYFDPPPPAPVGAGHSDFHYRKSTATTPAGLGDTFIPWVRGSLTSPSFGAVHNFSAIPQLSDCIAFTEPALLTRGGETYMATACVISIGGVRQPQLERLVLLRENGGGYDYVGVLLDYDDAVDNGGERIEQADLVVAQNGAVLLIGTPAQAATQSNLGCLVFEVTDLDTANVRRDGSGNAVKLMEITGDDTQGGPGACTYDSESATGVVMILHDDTPPNLVLFSMRATGQHPLGLDTDADGRADTADNCPTWPNPAQTLPLWSVPAGDGDCDGFPDTVTAPPGRGRENFIGTDATDWCADDTIVNNERGPTFGEPVSPWPPDVNDNRVASLADIILFGPWFNQIGPNPPNLLYNQRFDMNASGGVTLADIVAMGPFFNKFCTP